jgi:hypothetical protein
MQTSNPPIALEANSLYIATSQIMAPGKFHWAFYLTDAAGVATKHHWYQAPAGTGYAESYQYRVIDPVATYSNTGVATFVYLKVRGFTSPGATIFREVASTAFPEEIRFGFGSVRDNRQANLSCRTWVMRVLDRLINLGYIRNNSPLKWIEQETRRISMVIETHSAVTGLGVEVSYVGEI